jgi:hypothetical protein
VQAEIQAGTLSTRQWDEWLKPYPWQIELAQPLTLYEYSVNFVNAERTNNPLTREGMEAYRNLLLQPGPKPLPRKVLLYGRAPHKARYLVRVQQFDQAELRAAAEQLLQEHPARRSRSTSPSTSPTKRPRSASRTNGAKFRCPRPRSRYSAKTKGRQGLSFRQQRGGAGAGLGRGAAEGGAPDGRRRVPRELLLTDISSSIGSGYELTLPGCTPTWAAATAKSPTRRSTGWVLRDLVFW